MNRAGGHGIFGAARALEYAFPKMLQRKKVYSKRYGPGA